MADASVLKEVSPDGLHPKAPRQTAGSTALCMDGLEILEQASPKPPGEF